MILWAATISKTGADSVKIFDIGRVSPLGKLSKQAVDAMARSLAVSRSEIVASLKASSEVASSEATAVPGHGEKPEAPSTAPGLTFVEPATARAPEGRSRGQTRHDHLQKAFPRSGPDPLPARRRGRVR